MGNRLTALPLSFGDLTALKWLDLTGNDALEAFLPASIPVACSSEPECRACAKAVVAFMQQKQADKRAADEKKRKRKEKEAEKAAAAAEAEKQAERERKKLERAQKLAARQAAEQSASQEEEEREGRRTLAADSGSGSQAASRPASSLPQTLLLLLVLLAIFVLGALTFFSKSTRPADWLALAADSINWLSNTASTFL